VIHVFLSLARPHSWESPDPLGLGFSRSSVCSNCEMIEVVLDYVIVLVPGVST